MRPARAHGTEHDNPEAGERAHHVGAKVVGGGRIGARLRSRPLAATALIAVALEALLAVLGARIPALSTLVLLLAPGLAFLPVLPVAIRLRPVAALAAAPALGFAVSAIVVITASSAGVPLTATALRALLAATVAAGLLAFADGEPRAEPRRELLLATGGLLVAVAVGVLLQDRVIGGTPVPGNDWPKYVLYADEISRQHALLIDNPFWMLGVPFRDDPGTPALYGAYLTLTGQPAGALVHGIWVFAVMGVLSAFALGRALGGVTVAVLCAALWAVLPIDQDILGWHGLANVAALALLPLLLAQCLALTERTLERRERIGLAIVLLGIAAAHRLSAIVALAALGVAVVVALAAGRRLRAVTATAVETALWTGGLGAGVAYDLITRNRSFGGSLPYTAYATTKVRLLPVVHDLTWAFTVSALLAVGLALWWARSDRRLLVLLGLLAALVAAAYAWLLHVPLVYFRMAYYLPLVAVPLVALALHRLFRRGALAVGAALAIAIAVPAWGQADHVRRFYSFLDGGSPARTGLAERRAAPPRGRGGRPMLELPGHVAAAHAHARGPGARRHPAPRGGRPRATGPRHPGRNAHGAAGGPAPGRALPAHRPGMHRRAREADQHGGGGAARLREPAAGDPDAGCATLAPPLREPSQGGLGVWILGVDGSSDRRVDPGLLREIGRGPPEVVLVLLVARPTRAKGPPGESRAHVSAAGFPPGRDVPSQQRPELRALHEEARSQIHLLQRDRELSGLLAPRRALRAETRLHLGP